MSAGRDDAVAIVGMALRFPGAADPETYWKNLAAGSDSIRRGSGPHAAGEIAAYGAIDGTDLFDPERFGLSRRAAALMDPQHRLFLLCALEALERSALDAGRFAGAIGVFGGAGRNDYAVALRRSGVDTSDVLFELGNEKDYFATTVSHRLGLSGPGLTVQSACSTSLLAVHLAVRALRAGDCDAALAGGAAASWPPPSSYPLSEAGIASADGICRPFDERASGIVPGDGVAAVVLMRLRDALERRHLIHAIVRGTAANNDGYKASFSNVSRTAQAQVMRDALRDAGVQPAEVSYVEGHGSATRIGDAVECEAMLDAYASGRRDPLRIGSVKSNHGHLREAAGAAGLIKTVLMLRHRTLAPTLHFECGIRELRGPSGMLQVQQQTEEWSAPGGTRYAAVSSFGRGGTNVQVILEEPPARTPCSAGSWSAVPLSTSSAVAFPALLEKAAGAVASSDHSLSEIAATFQEGRPSLAYRRVVVCRDAEDFARKEAALPAPVTALLDPSVAFVFPGAGDHYADMASGLYEAVGCFRAHADAALDALAREGGVDVRSALFSARPPGAVEDGRIDIAAMLRRSRQRRVVESVVDVHAGLFVVEYALARLLIDRRVRPSLLIGHSLGEIVAATIGGIFSLDDAARFVCARARLITQLPAGAMLALPLPEDEVRSLLRGDLRVAAINAPSRTVVTGSVPDVESLAAELASRQIAAFRLPIDRACHHEAMLDLGARLEAELAHATLRPPAIPLISNVTGQPLEASRATDPGYWSEHLFRPVRFAEGAAHLREIGIVVECGPPTLASSIAELNPGTETVSMLRPTFLNKADVAHWLEALGSLWSQGVEVEWPEEAGARGSHLAELPGSPLELRPFGLPVAHVVPAPGPCEVFLHMPPRTARDARSADEPPSTPDEWRVAEAFRRVLGVSVVGRRDDFFKMGGDSLAAAQLVGVLTRAFGEPLVAEQIFAGRTVSGIAHAVRQGGAFAKGSAS